MNWFERMMRNVGLMAHNTTKPLRKDKSEKTIVNKEVEEKQVDEKTIIRRTTIEEIEIRKSDENE